MIDLIKTILNENHPEKAGAIMRSGNGYLAATPIHIMLEIIANAIEAVGPDNLDSESLYQAAESFSLTIDDFGYSFSDTKRTGVDALGIYELRADEREVFRDDPQWQPIEYTP